MSEPNLEPASLQAVLRDVERLQRQNGWPSLLYMSAVIVFFRWLSDGSYASNTIYLLVGVVVFSSLRAHHELAQAVVQLARIVERDSGAVRAETDPARASSPPPV